MIYLQYCDDNDLFDIFNYFGCFQTNAEVYYVFARTGTLYAALGSIITKVAMHFITGGD